MLQILFLMILNSKKKNKKKKYNFIIYYRKDGKLKKEYIFEIIRELKLLNLKVAILGDKIKIKGVKTLDLLQEIAQWK